MDTTYWNLFWSTGMPEAWLMSRDGAGPRPAGTESKPGIGPELGGLLAGSPAPLQVNVPGSQTNIY